MGMTKAIMDNIIDKATAQGIKNYVIRCENGNRSCYNNGETGVIVRGSDHITVIEKDRNYQAPGTNYSIFEVPYENIDSIELYTVPFATAKTIIENLGCYNDEVEAMFKSTKVQVGLIPGTAGIAEMKDDKGNVVLSSGMAGQVTSGKV